MRKLQPISSSHFQVSARPRSPNNFDAIRLIAALTVLFGHSFILIGAGKAPALFGMPVYQLAVAVFFAISGYLVAGSWQNVPVWSRFLWHRCLRIFPGLIVVVVVSVFVIGPLFSNQSTGSYFSNTRTYNYLQTATTLAQYDLPGVFTSAAHTRSAVNGSMWTLGVEFLCYFAVLVVGISTKRFRAIGFLFLAVLSVVITALVSGVASLAGVANAAPVMVYFAIAAIIRIAFPQRFLSWKILIPVVAIWFAITAIWPVVTIPVSWVAVPYCALTIGVASTPVVRSAARFGDLSYGTYLWAFVLQQIAIDWFGRLPVGWDISVVLAMTLIAAWFSWHLVESPALSLKTRPAFRPWLPRSTSSRPAHAGDGIPGSAPSPQR